MASDVSMFQDDSVEIVQTLNIGKSGAKIVSEKPQLTDANASMASIVERPNEEQAVELMNTVGGKKDDGSDQANAQDPTEEIAKPTGETANILALQ